MHQLHWVIYGVLHSGQPFVLKKCDRLIAKTVSMRKRRSCPGKLRLLIMTPEQLEAEVQALPKDSQVILLAKLLERLGQALLKSRMIWNEVSNHSASFSSRR
ncbi:MAG: hypothetical protein KME16_09330 [Scytolyngbya sp. HA4215-MV1]|nr:hypothetical protein [Scytolyngbya sp. HA4215-MV1]